MSANQEDSNLKMLSIVGEWTCFVVWDKIGSFTPFGLTIHEDGICNTIIPNAGKWTQDGNNVRWQFEEGFVYEGAIKSSEIMMGRMSSRGKTGRWFAIKQPFSSLPDPYPTDHSITL